MVRIPLGQLGFTARCLAAIFVVFILFSSLCALALRADWQHELPIAQEFTSSTVSSAPSVFSVIYPLRLPALGHIFVGGFSVAGCLPFLCRLRERPIHRHTSIERPGGSVMWRSAPENRPEWA